jgi:hypothetical protein
MIVPSPMVSRSVQTGTVGSRIEGSAGPARRLRDPRHLQQHRLDLGQLDPVAPDLDLGVDAAVVFDLTVVVDSAQVAGAVDAAARVVVDAEEVRDERPLREVVPVQVTRARPIPAIPISPISPNGRALSWTGSRITVQ